MKYSRNVVNSWSQDPQVNLGVDLIVYMRTSPDFALSRLKQRGRGEEHLIDKQYIEGIHQLHEDWLLKGNKIRAASIIVIDANRDLEDMKDFLANMRQ